MIDIQGLSAQYDDKIVLNNLTISFNKGLVHGLVGLNGSGKTTFLNTLFGFKKPLSGTMLFEGRPLKRTDIGYLETENFFYSNITGLEFLELFSNDLSDLPIWNELLLLPLDELVEYYSTGMKKKLAILAILKLNREILILDEPFNGLDLETTELVKKIIHKLRKQGKTILLTSHVFELLMGVCDEIHLLEAGSITNHVEQKDFVRFHRSLVEKIDANQQESLDRLFSRQDLG
jgi:ABC-2 type transport system ATP-binding protein